MVSSWFVIAELQQNLLHYFVTKISQTGDICLHTFYYYIWNYFLGGNSPQSNNIFVLQKRIIRIITNAYSKKSCLELFKKLNILLKLNILSLLLFVVKNIDIFKTNSEIHTLNTCQSSNLHLQTLNFAKYKKVPIIQE
jgi:hypothetical protein